MVIVAGITQKDDGGFRGDLLTPPVPERFERVAVVRVAIHPDDISLGIDPMDGLGDVLDPFEILGDFIHPIDEDKAPHLGELA